jgi:hypothetical protein
VVGSTGVQIAVARKRQIGSVTIELYRSGRSTDYPFGSLQVKLDAKGQGVGQNHGRSEDSIR